MIEGPLISVIVPVYNVKDYVTSTIRSLLNQTYRNLDILIIDDGSTDGSAYLCKKITENDKRVRILSKPNGGLSSVRNFGMHYIKGQYVSFLDGDDLLAPQAIERLITLALEYDVPLVSCTYKKISGNEVYNGYIGGRIEIIDGVDLLKKMLLLNGETGSPCAKLYAKSLFSLLTFPEVKAFEDFCVEANIFANCKKVCVCEDAIYGYRTRVGSITARKKYGLDHLNGMVASLDSVKNICRRYVQSENEIECFEAICLVRATAKLQLEDKRIEKDYVNQAKLAARRACRNKQLDIQWRLRLRLYSVSRPLYNVLYKIYGRLTGRVVG